MATEFDGESIRKVLERELGDQRVTWVEVETVVPACSASNARDYVDGRAMQPEIRVSVEAALAWRPYLRNQVEWAGIGDQDLFTLPCEVQRDAAGRVQRITAERGSYCVRIERCQGDLFSVFVTGVARADDIGLLEGHRLLPVLPSNEPDEWGRLRERDIDALVRSGAALGLLRSDEAASVSRERTEEPVARSHRRQKRAASRESSGSSKAVTVALAVVSAALLMSLAVQFGARSAEDLVAVDDDSVIVEKVWFYRVNQRLEQAGGEGRDPTGVREAVQYALAESGSLLEVALEDTGDGSRLSLFAEGDPAERSQDYGPLDIPREVGKWYDHEPSPVITLAKPMDVLTDERHPDDELVVVRRHRMRGVAVVEIRDLRGRLLREIWNRGYIYDISEGPRPGTMLVVGASNTLPQSVPGMAAWDEYLLTGSQLHVHPNFVALIDVGAVPERSGIFPVQATTSLPRTPTEYFLAQPSAQSAQGLQLHGVTYDRATGSVELNFTHFDNETPRTKRHFLSQADSDGRLAAWRTDDGQPLPEGFAASDLIPIDAERWGPAVDIQSEVEQENLPSDAAEVLSGGGGDNAVMADLRAASQVWMLDSFYNHVSREDIDPDVSARVLEQLNKIDASEWTDAHQQRYVIVKALAFLRAGAVEPALAVSRELHVDSTVPSAPLVEAKFVEALLLAHAGRMEEAQLVSEDALHLRDGLVSRRQWLVMCDRRTLRLIEELERLLTTARARPI